MSTKNKAILLDKKEKIGKDVYCFTGDLDWADEISIENMINLFQSKEIPLTFFVTHSSKIVEKYYDNPKMRRFVGLHFNFCKGSTQGNDYEEVVDYCLRLWETAVSYRSHRYFEDSEIAKLVASKGFKYDSNSVQFLQECYPIRQWNGLVRYPVFWEDDVHTYMSLPFELNTISNQLALDGIKVFDIHPSLLDRLEEKRFVAELLDRVRASNRECCYLDDIYRGTRR
jgi:hypothetical protein